MPGWQIGLCIPKVWILLLGRVRGSLFILKMQTLRGGAQTLEAEESEWTFGPQEVNREEQPSPGGNPRNWE